MIVQSDKKGFTTKPLAWQEAIRGIEIKNIPFFDTRPPKLGKKEDRDTLGIALTELGFTAEMSHWIIFWIMISWRVGFNSRSFVALRQHHTLAQCLDATGYDRLARYLRIRRMV